MPPVHERAAAIARKQYGRATRRQLIDGASIHPVTIWRKLRDGIWTECLPGVIDLGVRAPSWRGAVASLVLAAGPDAWASHETAAYLHRFLDAPRPSHLDVLVGRGRHAVVGGVRLHTTRAIGIDEVTVLHDLPCTTRARTLLDLAATTTSDVLERYLANLARQDAGLVRQVVELTDRHRRTPGRRRLLEVVARLPAGSGKLGSPLEVLGVQRLVRLDAPPFELQHTVLDGDGARIKRVDVAWPSARKLIEFDGADYHDLTAARSHDAAVRQRLRDHGWHVEVVRRADLDGPDLARFVRDLSAAV